MSKYANALTAFFVLVITTIFLAVFALFHAATNSLPIVVNNSVGALLFGLYWLVVAFIVYDIE
jgi:hypothetical protein